jgi:putative transposase
MGPVRLGVGAEWLLDGRAYRVVRQPAPDRFVALDVRFNVEREFTREDILARYASGELTFGPSADDTPRTAPTSPTVQDVRDLSEAEQQLLHRRWQAIEPLTRLGRSPVKRDFRLRAAQLRSELLPLSASTLRRYWVAWQRAGGSRLALLPTTARCGRRGHPRRHGMLQRYPLLGRLVEDAVRDVYLTLARRPIAAVVRRVLDDVQRANARLPAGQAVPLPKKAALARAVARHIKQLDPWEVDRRRWGRKIADRRHQGTAPRRLATRVLQRVEVDHSPLKVVVGTEAGPLGQPWLTVLIDYHSRLVVGFCLGFEPPSYAVLMEALRHAILPKAYVTQQYPRVRGPWPCYGVPELLVCDRGSDFTSNDLEAAAFQLGIELDFNPPRTPHFKGTVESFFGGLNDQLIASLPGRTFRSWERRADYRPEDGPLLPYAALLEVLHLYLVDVYARDRHPTLPCTRLEAWEASAAEFPPCLPASPDDLLVLLSKQARRNLSARGVELGGMFYSSPEVLALRAELAAKNLGTDGLTVRYNPWDLGAVWVLDPAGGRYLKADAADAALRGMTEYQWRVLKRAVRERFDQPGHVLTLAAGRNAIRDVVDAAAKKPSRRRRARAARFLQPPPPAAGAEPPPGDDAWTDVPLAGAGTPPGPAAPPGPPPGAAKPDAEATAGPAEPRPAPPDPDEIDVADWGVSDARP